MRTSQRVVAPLAFLCTLVLLTACELVGEASGPAATGSAAVTPTSTPRLTQPAPTPEPTLLVYKVQPNDKLAKIAKRFKTTVDSIGYWNRARYKTLDPDSAAYAPDSIKIGWLLRIHPGQTTDGDFVEPTRSPPASPSPSASPSA
jgi:hypothetical protein